MCVIIQLEPNQMLPYDKFENAVFNNPHGYGIVLKEGKKIQIIRECPEKGNDPMEIYKVLEDNKDILRYVHLRYNTVGETSLDNTHPFDVISSKQYGDVVFMHNGTLYKYKDTGTVGEHTYTQHGARVWKESSGPAQIESDSRRYCETFLTPLMANWKGKFTDPVLQEVIKEQWSNHSNKGLIISSKDDPLELGTWLTIDGANGANDKVKVSNNDYFSTLKRGPEYERQKYLKEQEEKKLKEKEEKEAKACNQSAGYPGNEQYKPDWESANDLKIEVEKMMAEVELYEGEDGILALGNITDIELQGMQKEPEYLSYLLCYVVSQYQVLYEANIQQRVQIRKAEKAIVDFKEGKRS